MNFNGLLKIFESYLSNKNLITDEEKSKLNSEEKIVSVFQNEFKSFLVEQMGANTSILNMDIGEIIELCNSHGEDEDEAIYNGAEELPSETQAAAGAEGSTSILPDTPIAPVPTAQMTADAVPQAEISPVSAPASDESSAASQLNQAGAATSSVPDKEDKTYDLSFISDVYDGFSDEELQIIGTLFDSDGDGELSDEEHENAQKMLSKIGNEKGEVTKEDYESLQNYITTLTEAGMTNEEIIENIKSLDGTNEDLTENDFVALKSLLEAGSEDIAPNQIMEQSGAAAVIPGGPTPNSPAITEKNLNNMSIEDLQKEYDSAEQKEQEAYDKYLSEAEKIDAELTEKIKDKNSEIKDKESELDDAKSRVSDLNSQIADLEAQKNEPDADVAAIDAKICKLKEEKEKLENETIPGLENELNDLKTELDELNKELFELANSNPELVSLKRAYEEAKDYKETVKEKLDLRKADEEKSKNRDMVDNSEGPKDYRGGDGYDYTNLPMTYNLDGQEYHCVGFTGYDTDGDGEIDFQPDSWEEVQRLFANAGLTNKGKYGTMQCHNYSNALVDFCLGTINRDVLNAIIGENENPNYGDLDMAGKLAREGKYNTRDCLQCHSSSRDEERAIIENELQNGRPCLVSVPYRRTDGSTGQHWVAAVGIADNGDILIWDSYNSTMEKLGCSSNSDSTKLHRNMATGNGIMVFVEGSSYQYNQAGSIYYWPEYVEQDAQTAIYRDSLRWKNRS